MSKKNTKIAALIKKYDGKVQLTLKEYNLTTPIGMFPN
jgi:hypothetical protein